MQPLPDPASPQDLVAAADRWAGLLEAEDYAGALAFVLTDQRGTWTADRIRTTITSYNEARPDQKVTVDGEPTDITQRKEVTFWEQDDSGAAGELWYDLNIDGLASDLTATFDIVSTEAGIMLRLNDIHVM